MVPHPLRISESLVQHYLLEVLPCQLETVRDSLLAGGRKQSAEQSKVHEWKLFTWLDRPAIWALRSVGVTSGLDTFLLESGGLPGVIDVAELMTYVLTEPGEQIGGLTRSWSEFVDKLTPPGVLFASFLWPDWDAFAQPMAWGSTKPVPVRSQILAAIRMVFEEALRAAEREGVFKETPVLLLAGSVGDSDLVLYGQIRHSSDLDACLYLLAQIGCDSLATALYGPECGAQAPAWPVFKSSHTELAVDLDLYLPLLSATRRQQRGADGAETRELVQKLDNCMQGELFPEIGLTRGRSPLVQLKEQLAQVAGPGWCDRAVLGREDLILQPEIAHTLAETVALLARLDAASCEIPGFPRRSSLRLGFGSPLGRELRPPERQRLFSVVSQLTTSPTPVPNSERLNEASVAPLLELIEQMRAIGWREDLRILERMAERCVTLQKSPAIRRETRQMLYAAFDRIAATCRRIIELETAPLDQPSRDGQPDASPLEVERVAREARLLRNELLNAGKVLDRVLSHHSKGVIPLLLHPASQARGPEHFGSEVGLSHGLSVLFRSPIVRLRDRLKVEQPADANAAAWLHSLDAQLVEFTTPIIYASHDPDFYIRTRLTLLRVPRWALWYPSAASHLLHELGHALTAVSSFAELLQQVLWRLASGRPIGWPDKHCPHLEAALLQLGALDAKAFEDHGAVRLQEFAASSFPWRATVAFCDHHKVPPADHRRLDSLEEIVADVVALFFSHFGSAPGEPRELWDCFDYFAPFTSRNDSGYYINRLSLLLAAHITERQLWEIQHRDLAPFSAEGSAELWQITQAATETFFEQLRMWAEDFCRRTEHVRLAPAALQAIQDLPGYFKADSRPSLATYQTAAHLLAGVLSLPALRASANRSLFQATQLWSHVVALAREAPHPALDEEAILVALSEGTVPLLPSAYPERLPRALAWRYHHLTRHEVPAHVRLALSCYLCDLYQP